jgi:hypothetical protein
MYGSNGASDNRNGMGRSSVNRVIHGISKKFDSSANFAALRSSGMRRVRQSSLSRFPLFF